MIINKKIILASSSPRRIEILKKMGFNVTPIKHTLDEDKAMLEFNNLDAENLVVKLAELKAESVKNKYTGNIIIAADTIVLVNNEILGKPKDKKEAKIFLRMLSNKTHSVITGYSIIFNEIIKSDFVESFIKVKKIDESEIEYFVKNEKYLDAAGAYKIQGLFSLFIEEIKGCWFNIVGLPISRIYEEIKLLM